MREIKPKETPLDPLAAKRHSNARLDALAAAASPATVSEASFRKLFENWERAGITISKARQMLADALVLEQQCAEEIVRKLGRGQFRYKETLYMVSSNKNTVYLRALTKRDPHG